MSDGLAARRAAAQRLPPLADGRRDPELEQLHQCHICRRKGTERVLFELTSSKRWMCKDRVGCFRRARIR